MLRKLREKMSYTARIREIRWKKIEKKAWEISKEADRIIKPTDILDAILYKYTDGIKISDIEEAKENR
jgi:hypothetical protein